VLDNPAWHALIGPQRSLGRVTALAARYQSDISPFGALGANATTAHWVHLAQLIGPGGTVSLTGDPPEPPATWAVVRHTTAVQMVFDGDPADLARSEVSHATSGGPGSADQDAAGGDIESLGPEDVPSMLRLVELAEPGPFRTRTVRFGGYVGIRHQGHLVAMVGERLRPPGYAEISALATDPAHRNQGLASRLVRVVANGIVGRGEVPFLHASIANTDAIRLYESLGFAVRRNVVFLLVRAPE
jgi:ribosomal protein S18 acetylase RimI-like enzyme